MDSGGEGEGGDSRAVSRWAGLWVGCKAVQISRNPCAPTARSDPTFSACAGAALKQWQNETEIKISLPAGKEWRASCVAVLGMKLRAWQNFSTQWGPQTSEFCFVLVPGIEPEPTHRVTSLALLTFKILRQGLVKLPKLGGNLLPPTSAPHSAGITGVPHHPPEETVKVSFSPCPQPLRS